MDMVVLKYLLPFFTFITGTVCQDLSITLSMNPSTSGGKVVRGSTVEFRCTVDKNILGHGTVEWYRRQGVNRYQLGTGISMNSYLTTAPRYSLAMDSQTSSIVVYRLAISDVQVEDSAVIECAAGKPSMRKAMQTLIICADLSSELCDCMLKSGWSSPDCIYKAVSDEGFERASIGLAVCLAVTLLYAALATAVVVYDCRYKLKEKRLKEEEREASLAHTAAVISSQTAASSAMKPRSVSTAANSRPTVRFNNNSVQNTDINC